jgi:hypothetical protein
MLTISSLLAILFMTFHLADDVVRGFEPGGFKNIQSILTMFAWLFGTLLLAKRRSGYIVMLLGAILGMLATLAHMRGKGLVGGRIAGTHGMFFWVWTVYALGLTSLLSFVLSSHELWKLPWRRSRKSTNSEVSA